MAAQLPPPLEERILLFIHRFQEDRGYPPTVRQIVRATRAHSTSTVQHRIRLLQAQGRLARRASCRELWEITDPRLTREARGRDAA